jgi:hypothetical protein
MYLTTVQNKQRIHSIWSSGTERAIGLKVKGRRVDLFVRELPSKQKFSISPLMEVSNNRVTGIENVISGILASYLQS